MGSTRPIDPAALGADISEHLNFLIEAALARSTFDKLGKITEELSLHYRALGICVLVSEDDSDAFFHWLIQSAVTRRYYLVGVDREGGGQLVHRRASFVDPVLDAVAAHQWPLATQLCNLASATWLKGEEYEDDFLYGDFWRAALNGEMERQRSIAKRWREVLEGQQDRRLDLVDAFLSADKDATGAKLRDLLDEAEQKAKKTADLKADSIAADEYTFFPNRWVSVEGLAWLALTEARGLPLEGGFSACPESIRKAQYAPFEPLAYPTVPL